MSARTVLSLGHGNSSLPWHYLAPGNKGCARRQTSWWDGCSPLLGSLTAHGRTTFTLWSSVTVASSKHLRAEVIAWWDPGAPHYRENVHSHFKPWESVQSWEESLNQSQRSSFTYQAFYFQRGLLHMKARTDYFDTSILTLEGFLVTWHTLTFELWLPSRHISNCRGGKNKCVCVTKVFP